MQPEWAERYGTRVENYRFLKADTERQRLATLIGADGFTLLLAAYASDSPAEVRSTPAVEVLCQIWVSSIMDQSLSLAGGATAMFPHPPS
jgi:transposase